MNIFKSLFKKKPNYFELISKGTKVVDVRTNSEFKQGHFPSSINIPLDSINQQIDTLQKFEKIILVCRSGLRARNAKAILKEKGIEAVNAGAWQNLNSK
jgi:rhodanese-related sulfurtransferase